MVFSSHIFLFLFLPAALGLYYVAPRRARHLLLTLASYLFYGWANPLFVVLMAASTAIDYACGLVMVRGQPVGCDSLSTAALLDPGTPRTRSQRAALVISICSNLALLGFFKYFNFALDSYNGLVSALALDGAQLDLWFRVTLPLGISFYTFQSMSYSIDVYKGEAQAIRNPLDFACYVAMFPQLVAGPIVRFREVADQLLTRNHSAEKFARGVAFLSLGLGKKVLLANPCGQIADTCFGAAGPGLLDTWYGVSAYAFQVYFDFSGYSDMAIGLGLMLGFVFAKNFDSPYHSASVTEFWRRWHLSLSTWLRDYLYIPLGGNRHTEARTYLNLAAVMLLGGLWHGASWTFVVWGGIHGALLAVERALGPRNPLRRLPRPLAVAITFVVLLFTWAFFRAPTFAAALAICGRMLGLVPAGPTAGLAAAMVATPYHLLCFGVAALLVWTAPQTWDFTRRLSLPKAAFALGVFALALVALTTQSYNPFIYFIF